MCEVAQKSLGVEILVENKPGGGGLVGASFLANSKPDGYLIGMIGTSPFTTIPNFQKIDFDPLTAFVPIAQFTSSNEVIQVSASSPLKTLKNFVEEGQKRQVTAGTSGAFTHAHIAMQRFGLIAKMNLKLVPFGGDSEAIGSILGGQLDAGVLGGGSEYVRAGKLRMLARLNTEATGAVKEIPSLKDLGYDIEIVTGMGVFGPKGLPDTVRKTLEEAFGKAARDPAVVETIGKIGNNAIYRNGKDYETFLRQANERSTREIKELGLGIWSSQKK
jgi:tripartite-type tricarboxylate transporter receptor subunit TctC